MSTSIVIFLCFFFIATVNTIAIPFINNAIFVAISNSTSIKLTNLTCSQCLCTASLSSMILNCFPNDTCEFFNAVPSIYRVQALGQALVYFPQQIFPNASQCCMSNTSFLLQRLNEASSVMATVRGSRCLAIDDNGYIVGIARTNRTLIRLNPTNLTVVNQPVPPTFTADPLNLAYHDQAYYVGFVSFILVMSSANLTILANLTAPLLSGTRDMIFLNGGQTMVVVSTSNAYLLFFNRSSSASGNYTFTRSQSVTYTNPHGLFYINDTFFYTTSWARNTVYTYSNPTTNGTWTERLVLNASSTTNSSDGNHVTVDDCGRYWFSIGRFGLRVYDSQGIWLGSVSTPTSASIFDATITEDYVIYYSDSTLNRIVRIDPGLLCWHFFYQSSAAECFFFVNTSNFTFIGVGSHWYHSWAYKLIFS